MLVNQAGVPVQTSSAAGVETPVVIDLGKVKRRRVKDLKRGQGALMGEVHAALLQMRTAMAASGQDKQIVPVVVLYKVKKKKKAGKGSRAGMWGF
jgi:hypothetical protein